VRAASRQPAAAAAAAWEGGGRGDDGAAFSRPKGTRRGPITAACDCLFVLVCAAVIGCAIGGAVQAHTVRRRCGAFYDSGACGGGGGGNTLGLFFSDAVCGESKQLVVESPWSLFTSACQRF
jgi:hypothetical protein